MLNLIIFLVGVIGLGECVAPSVTPFKDFEIPKYMGVWYEAYRIDNAPLKGQECGTDVNFQLSDTAFRCEGKTRLPSGKIFSYSGTSTLISPGILSWKSKQFPDGNYTILGTDYLNFGCEFVFEEADGRTYLYGWIVSREVSPSEETIQAAFAIFEKNGIDSSLFTKVHQGDDCQYKHENNTE